MMRLSPRPRRDTDCEPSRPRTWRGRSGGEGGSRTSAIARAEAGDFASALAEARSIKTVERRIFALNGVGAALQRAGHGDDAASSFEQAIGAAQSLAGAKQLNELMLIAESQASVGLPNATATYDLALKTAKAQNSIFFPNVIASLRANSGEIVEALRDASSIEEPDKSIALASIVSAQLKAARIADASELASGIDYDEERLHALVAVAQARTRESQRGDRLHHAGAVRRGVDSPGETRRRTSRDCWRSGGGGTCQRFGRRR